MRACVASAAPSFMDGVSDGRTLQSAHARLVGLHTQLIIRSTPLFMHGAARLLPTPPRQLQKEAC
jgi:hypothetical protein